MFPPGLWIFSWVEVTRRHWAARARFPAAPLTCDLGLGSVPFLGLSFHVCEMGWLSALRSVTGASRMSYDSFASSTPLGWEMERAGWKLTVWCLLPGLEGEKELSSTVQG